MAIKEGLGPKPENYPTFREAPKNVGTLFKNIVASGKKGERRDLPRDMRDYLNLQGIRVNAEHQGLPDPNKLLILTPNHHSRNSRFTTMESLNLVAASAVGAFDIGLTDRHTAWVIKQLDVCKFGPGKLARQVQNAAITCYGQIPIKVEKRLIRRNGVLPRFRERFANVDQFQGLLLENIMQSNNIGYFPEQTPTHNLKPFNSNYPKFIRGLQAVAGDFQIVPITIFYQEDMVNVRFGQIIQVAKNSAPSEIAEKTMQRIAANMPVNLRGVYR